MFAEVRPASALKCRDISVRYGDVAALTGVSVEFAPKLIHAVVGQNGAGKTTFARVVSGLVRPDTGAIEIDDRQVAPGHVNRSRAAGVELVHQSFALPPSFTVAEAMEFGARRGRPIFSRRALEARWKQHLENLGVQARMGDRIRDLPVESQQGVEIARALVADAKLLILDEPTAVLSPSGVETLFRRLRGLKASGVTILLVLHKIREVLAVADTVTVLRGGKLVQAPTATSAVEPHELSAAIIGAEAEKALTPSDEEALVGSELLSGAGTSAAGKAAAPLVLAMDRVSTRPDSEGPVLSEASLAIAHGEIVGVAGVRRQRPAHVGACACRARRNRGGPHSPRRARRDDALHRREAGARLTCYSVRTEQRRPQPIEPPLGELVGAPASARVAFESHLA